MKSFLTYLSEMSHVDELAQLLRDYSDWLPIKPDLAQSPVTCPSGNCADHAKRFVQFARQRGFDADHILLQDPKGEGDHLAAMIGKHILDPTYHFFGETPNSIGGHISHIHDFRETYGKHGMKMGTRGTIEEIESTPYEHGGAGGPITFTKETQ